MFFTYVYYASYIILIPGILFSLWAQVRVQSTYAKHSKVYASSGWNGNEMSQMLIEKYDLNGVVVQPIGGKLTDNYDPKTDILNLSQEVYGGTSVAALGVAAHECGHAVQQHNNYFPIKLRQILVPVTNIGSRLAIPVAIVGLLIEWIASSVSVAGIGEFILELGVVLYSLTTIFALITLPVEINASKRAGKMLEETGVLYGEELRGAKSVLYAAALTYMASLLVSFLYLFRFLIIIGSLRKKD